MRVDGGSIAVNQLIWALGFLFYDAVINEGGDTPVPTTSGTAGLLGGYVVGRLEGASGHTIDDMVDAALQTPAVRHMKTPSLSDKALLSQIAVDVIDAALAGGAPAGLPVWPFPVPGLKRASSATPPEIVL